MMLSSEKEMQIEIESVEDDRSDRFKELLQEARMERQSRESEIKESDERPPKKSARAKAIEDVVWSGRVILIMMIVGMVAIIVAGVVMLVISPTYYGLAGAIVCWAIFLPFSYIKYVFTKGIINSIRIH